MCYESIEITPIMEHSNNHDANNQMFIVELLFKNGYRTIEGGEVTYIHSLKTGDLFLYDTYLHEFMNGLDSEEREEIHNKIKQEIRLEQQSQLLLPLTNFICDKCNKVMHVDEACLQYYAATEEAMSFDFLAKGIQIVHNEEECTYKVAEIPSLGAKMVGEFTGTDGLANLLGILEEYPETNPKHEMLEIIKRSQLPYYEEARFHKDLINENSLAMDWKMRKYNRSALRAVLLESKNPEESKRRNEAAEANYRDLLKQGKLTNISGLFNTVFLTKEKKDES